MLRMRHGLVLLLLLMTAGEACAHGLGVDCTRRGDRVDVEAFYDDDTPAREAAVQVVNAAQRVIASGITDRHGKWSLALPLAGQYEVRVDAGAGHRAHCTMSVPARGAEASAPVLKAMEQKFSTGPKREEFTRFPWLKVLIGLGVIGGCSGAFLLAARSRRQGVRSDARQGPAPHNS